MITKGDVEISFSDPEGGLTIYASYGGKTAWVSCGYESYGQPHGPDMVIIPSSGFQTWDDGTPIDGETRRAIFAAISAATVPVMYRWG